MGKREIEKSGVNVDLFRGANIRVPPGLRKTLNNFIDAYSTQLRKKARTSTFDITPNVPVNKSISVKRNHENSDGKHLPGTILFILRKYRDRIGRMAVYSVQELNQFLYRLNDYMLSAKSLKEKNGVYPSSHKKYNFTLDGALEINNLDKYVNGDRKVSDFIMKKFCIYGIYGNSSIGNDMDDFKTFSTGNMNKTGGKIINVAIYGAADVGVIFPGDIIAGTYLHLILGRHKELSDPYARNRPIKAYKTPSLSFIGWSDMVLRAPSLESRKYMDPFTNKIELGNYVSIGQALFSSTRPRSDGFVSSLARSPEDSIKAELLLVKLDLRQY